MVRPQPISLHLNQAKEHDMSPNVYPFALIAFAALLFWTNTKTRSSEGWSGTLARLLTFWTAIAAVVFTAWTLWTLR